MGRQTYEPDEAYPLTLGQLHDAYGRSALVRGVAAYLRHSNDLMRVSSPAASYEGAFKLLRDGGVDNPRIRYMCNAIMNRARRARA